MKRRGFLKLFGLGTAAAAAAPLLPRGELKAFTEGNKGFYDDGRRSPDAVQFLRPGDVFVYAPGDGQILMSPDGCNWTDREPR